MIVDIKLDGIRDYQIFIEPLANLTFNKKVAIVTNPKVAGFHLKTLLNYLNAKELIIITVADGEQYKNQESVDFILDRLFDAKFDRNSILIAFGGGVIGDMVGYCASIYQRGIDFIQIPTTLLAQVDSSVGGKTGINNRFGKNLIGSFYQPKAVYIDVNFLNTLPKREFLAGVAEIIKMAVMFDLEFFNFLEQNSLEGENLKIVIKKSVELKAKVVSLDEREAGVRAVLNYGHTFAHVIETITNYSTYLHGEAVAIGIVMANRLALKLGLISEDEEQRVKNLLIKLGLPTEFKILNIEEFYLSFYLDKKSKDSKLNFIVPNKIGDYKIVSDLEKELIIDVLREFI